MNDLSVLVVQTPNDCFECLYFSHRNDKCELAKRHFENCEGRENKPKWCPLRPLPEKKKTYYVQGMYNFNPPIPKDFLESVAYEGWNACLDKITGETE